MQRWSALVWKRRRGRGKPVEQGIVETNPPLVRSSDECEEEKRKRKSISQSVSYLPEKSPIFVFFFRLRKSQKLLLSLSPSFFLLSFLVFKLHHHYKYSTRCAISSLIKSLKSFSISGTAESFGDEICILTYMCVYKSSSFPALMHIWIWNLSLSSSSFFHSIEPLL